jgi:hypothetical protein
VSASSIAESTPAPSDSVALVPPAPAPNPCRSAAFDLDALPAAACEHHPADAQPSQTSKLVLSVVPDVSRARSGESVPVTVAFTNKGADPMEVVVNAGCTGFELSAYDARGTRRDVVLKGCGIGHGCAGTALRLVIEAGGVLTKHLVFRTSVKTATAATECKSVETGNLPPGKYTLRVTSVLDRWLEGEPTMTPPSASTPIEIVP